MAVSKTAGPGANPGGYARNLNQERNPTMITFTLPHGNCGVSRLIAILKQPHADAGIDPDFDDDTDELDEQFAALRCLTL
jgi:hypothetical protein